MVFVTPRNKKCEIYSYQNLFIFTNIKVFMLNYNCSMWRRRHENFWYKGIEKIPTTKFGVDFFSDILFIFLLGINIFYLNVYAFIWYVRFLLAKKKQL